MTNYNKAVAIWQSRKISNDAELAEALTVTVSLSPIIPAR